LSWVPVHVSFAPRPHGGARDLPHLPQARKKREVVDEGQAAMLKRQLDDKKAKALKMKGQMEEKTQKAKQLLNKE
jgi:hypothetical protein